MLKRLTIHVLVTSVFPVTLEPDAFELSTFTNFDIFLLAQNPHVVIGSEELRI